MRRKREKGLTLIELLTVVAIVAILAAILIPYTFNRLEDSRIARMEEEISSIRSAIVLFFNDNATIPTIWQDLVIPPTGFNNWRGPYINKAPNTTTATWNQGTPWKTNLVLYRLVGAAADNRFAATTNLYPFRNAFAIEIANPVVGGSPTIPLSSLQKIDQDIDNGAPGSGFMIEANPAISPFITTTNMAGLNTGANYAGAGRSAYILIFTY